MLDRNTIALTLVAALLGGCSLWPGYKREAMDLPTQWSDAPVQGKAVVGERWWTLYGDATLDALVDEALKHNRDLAVAAARVDEARALLRITDSQRAPSVDANANAARSRSSARSSIPLPPGVPLVSNDYTATVNV